MAFTLVTQGTFTQPATAVNQIIPVQNSADYFVTTNLTKMASANTTGCVRGEWYGNGLTAVNDGLQWSKTAGDAIAIQSFATAGVGGFTYVTSLPAPEAAVVGTTITNANPAVASATNTYSNGDQVVIYNAVGMQQISGMKFTISSVSGNTFTLLGLNASGFSAGATAFTVRRVSQFTPVEPSFLYVTAISRAANAQVTVSQANSVYLGQKLEFQIPGSFGMVQLNNFNQPQSKPIVVTSIIDAYNFTININTSAYTAFVFPTSAQSPTAQLFATVAPAGQSTQYNFVTGVQTGYNFNQLPFHSGISVPYMYLPAGVGSPAGQANEIIMWQAYKMETGTINAQFPSF